MATTIDQIQIEIVTDSKSASSGIESLTKTLEKLKSVTRGGLGLTSVARQLKKINEAVSAQTGYEKIKTLSSSLESLSSVSSSKFNLGRVANQVSKLNESLIGVDTSKIDKLANSLKGLSSVGTIDLKLPTKGSMGTENTNISKLFDIGKFAVITGAVHKLGSAIGDAVENANKYIEDTNLFTVAMGEYAEEARNFAQEVENLMGVDMGDWQRNQGTFMTITNGFGVASDEAYKMSKNLTQLGYDISSFFNLSVEESMAKLQSGIAGELEPLRRIGYDLSVARLQQEAYKLGIDKTVQSMTQAEKAELRYHAILTQVTSAQGDMARTLESPANQLRILQAQIRITSREIGNIFIPILQAVVPVVTAVVRVIRILITTIAGLFGKKITDFSEALSTGINTGAVGTSKMADNMGKAASNAKAMKSYLMGIDELNVISPETPSSSGGSGVGDIGGGSLGIDLPEYDFGLSENPISKIVDSMLEWLGLTGEINSWADLLDTKFGKILTVVGLIGAGFLAWKIADGVLDGIKIIKGLKDLKLDKLALGIAGLTLVLTGAFIEFQGLEDAIKSGVNWGNIATTISGGLLVTIGGAMLGVATGIGALLGGAIAGLIAAIPMYIIGIRDAIVNEWNVMNGFLIQFGATSGGAAIGAIIGSLGGPIGTGIGALIGLAVGLITNGIILIVQNWDKVKEFFANTIEGAKEMFTNVGTNVTDFVKGIGTKIKEFFTNTIPNTWNNFKSWLKSIWENFKNVNAREIGHHLGVTIASTLKKFFTETIPNFIKSAVGSIKKFFGETLPNALHEAMQKIKNWFTDFKKSIDEWVLNVKEVIIEFWSKTLPAFLNETLPKIVEDIVGFFSGLPAKFKEIGKNIISGLFEGLSTMKTKLVEFVQGFVDGFKEGLGIHSPSRVFKEIGGFTVEGFNIGLSEQMGTTKAIMERWSSDISSFNPKLGYEIDPKSLEYVNESFAKRVSVNGSYSQSFTSKGYEEALEKFFSKNLQPYMSRIADDTKRQADKEEQTNIYLDSKPFNKAIVNRERTGGYNFTR